MKDKDRAKAQRMLTRQVDTGGMAVDKALAALKGRDPAEFPPYMIAKLLETGAAVSVTALAALRELDAEERPEDDPWARIAAELDPHRRVSADDKT